MSHPLPAPNPAGRPRAGHAIGRVVLPRLTVPIVRALGATLRLEQRGVDALVPLWHANQPLIYIIWHGRILMTPWVNAALRRSSGARRVTVLASRSRDGEMVAQYAQRFGLAVVRGSSSRGGTSAARALATTLRDGGDVALVPDGPRGPARRLGPGVVMLAALTGAPVVPFGFGARPARTLRTWDRFLIPLPFARAGAVFGTPITVAVNADRERIRGELERALDDVTQRADALAGGADGTERNADAESRGSVGEPERR